MRTFLTIHAALLLLGTMMPALATHHDQPVVPVPAVGAPTQDEVIMPRSKPVAPPLPPRGQMLYENHCMACHESGVHIRSDQHVRSLDALRGQVSRWADHLHLDWGPDERADVVNYLDRHYYRFESRE